MGPLTYSGEEKKNQNASSHFTEAVITLIVGTGFSLASFRDQTFSDQIEGTTL